MGALRSEATLGQLFGMLASDTGQLLRGELRLASFEVVERARDATAKIGVVALGGLIAQAGLIGVLFAAVIGLSLIIPLWASALIIGALVFGGGTAIVMKGLKALRPPQPSSAQTLDTPSGKFAGAKDGLR